MICMVVLPIRSVLQSIKIKKPLIQHVLKVHFWALFNIIPLYWWWLGTNMQFVVMRERERSNFLNRALSPLTHMAGFTSCFLKVRKHHYLTLFFQWHLSFSVQSNRYALPLVFSKSFSVAHALFFLRHSKFNALLKTCSYLVLHSLWLIHPKYLLNPANSYVFGSIFSQST